MGNNDRVYLAYSGQLGEQFENKTKERIQWILEQAGDKQHVLDIGCSQGIVSILLAEQGKNVKGIDIQEEAIDFAKNLVHEKYQHVENKVTFECMDFMDYEMNEKFDCIVITEVLEHLNNPKAFLEKASKLLEDNGIMIISVPFGVMDHPDHVSTFYMNNFFELINCYLDVYSLNFMGRWLGCTAGQKDSKATSIEINTEQIQAEEKNFELIDREMTVRISELYKNWTDASTKYRQVTEQYKSMKEKYIEAIEKQKDLLENKDIRMKELQNQKEEVQRQIGEYQKQIEKLQNQLEKEKTQLEAERVRVGIEKDEVEEKYQSTLKNSYQDLSTTIELIDEMSKKMDRLNGQYKNAVDMNEQYRTRIEKIENNIIWKCEIKAYRKLKAIKRKIVRG